MEAEPTGGMEGQIIAGRYQLIRLLGRGGMGAVYEGRNTVTYKRCALKVLLSPELATETEAVGRFFREARAGSVIESDHVVEVYDSGFDPTLGVPYMVMEYLSGEDLQATMARLGALDQIAAVKIVLHAATGLARAHQTNIVHRDIKPANLFLSQRDEGGLVVKILDFGIAKVKMENFHDASTGLTRTGSMLGTPLYMSPEQCKGASAIDARSDVWSLGVVLWELLTGSSPYSSPSSLGSLMASIITEELPLIQDHAPWVAPELAEIVHRAMSRDLAQRFGSATELRDALLGIAPGGPQLHSDMLKPVSTEQRASTAPRLVLSDEGILRATGRTGLSVTHTRAVSQRGRSLRWVLGALAGFALVGMAGAALLKFGKPPDSMASAGISTPLATPERAPGPEGMPGSGPKVTPIQPLERVTKRFQLQVAPARVSVQVEGAPAEVKDGKVEIEGFVGSTRRVRLALGARSDERIVAVAESGLVPDRIELGVAPRVPPAPARVNSAQAKASSPPPPSPKAPPPKRSTGLSEGTDEFK